MDVEDETTQTSSPGGGWQGRLSAFLHVHRGSRASSRKSSRASDASDLSELGGPWLNLPLLLLSNAVNMDPEELHLARESHDVNIRVSEATPEATTPLTPLPDSAQPRRRSVYNFPFFLRHQDAVETPDDTASPPAIKKPLKPSGTTQSLHPAMAEEAKPKRGSLIRRKRASSVKIKPSKNALGKAESAPLNGADVSILVTEPSPETPSSVPPLLRQQSESTVVHVLVHRESEEYRDEEQRSERTTSPTICVTDDNQECHDALTVTVTPSDCFDTNEEHQDS